MNDDSLNISSIIISSINSIFSSLFSSIDNSIYSILDDITFIDSNIISNNTFKDILGISSNSGILIITNTLLFGIILYYSVSRMFSYFTGSEIQSSKNFIFRTIIFGILMNSSYFICEQIININFLLCLAIRNVGEIIYNKEICFSSLITEINSSIIISNSNENFNIFSVDGIIKSFISIGLFNLIFSYSLRYILIKVFILLCPFAIICLINDKTKWIFSSWIKIVMSLLLLQILVSLILLVCFSFNYSNDILSKLMYIGCIYALIKANSIIKEFIGGINTSTTNPISNFKTFLGGK